MPAEIEKLWDQGATMLKDHGAEIVEISLPHTKFAPAVYYVLASAECSSNLARFDGVRYGYRCKDDGLSLNEMYARTRAEGFGNEVKKRILVGTYVLSSGYYDAYYKKALRVRNLIAQDFKNVFGKIDAILAPTTPNAAFPLSQTKNPDPIKMYLNDVFTIPASLAGLPTMSVPAGLNEQGLPMGLQIITNIFDEQTMLNMALAIEETVKCAK